MEPISRKARDDLRILIGGVVMSSKPTKKTPFRVRSPLQDNLLSLCGILSLIILTFSMVCLVLWLLSYTEILDISLFQMHTETIVQGDETAAPSIYDALRPVESSEADAEIEVTRFSGDFSVLRSMLDGVDVPQSYCIEVETVVYGSSTADKQLVRIYSNGPLFRIQRYRTNLPLSSGLIEEYVCDGSQIAYTDNSTKQTKYFPISDQFSLEAIAGVPSLASFHEIADDQIKNASYARIDDQIIYYVQFQQQINETAALIQEYWISPESEFVIRCMTYPPTDISTTDPGDPIYSCELVRTRVLSSYEKSTMFVIPSENE